MRLRGRTDLIVINQLGVESECIVVPPTFLKHLKKLPEHVLSFNEAVEEVKQKDV